MKPSNICKFPPSGHSNELSVYCFVLETDPKQMQSKYVLSHHRMILIEEGEGELAFDGEAYSFSVGTLFFGFEGECLSLLSGENVRYLYIDFDGARANTLFHRFGIYPKTRRVKGFHGVIPFCKECLLNARKENIDIMAESVLLYVFSRLSATEARPHPIVQRMIEMTEENFQDADLSLSGIAKKMGYNPKYLSHFFKEKMGVTYVEYLRSYRFQYAISLFELGISSVKNVALLSGFSDPLYFSNSFKKVIGISPTDYIKKQER